MKTATPRDSSPVNRRTFCNGLLLTSTALILPETAAVAAAPSQDSMVAYPPRRIDGAEMLMPGASLYFNYPSPNDPAVLLRLSEGEFKAYSRRCSHAGCSVEYDGRRRCLSCPCHHGAFDARVGHAMYGPPRNPLDEIVLQVRAGGHVWAVGKSFGRNAELIASGGART